MSKQQVKRADIPELLAWALRRRARYKVSGRSMLPLLSPHDQVLAKPTGRRKVQAGDLVVVAHPHQKAIKLVKQVDRVSADGRVWIKGLNPKESTDSSSFGPVSAEAVEATVTSVFR